MVGGLGLGCSTGLVSLELALGGSVSFGGDGGDGGGVEGVRPTEWVRCDFFLELFQGFVVWWW